MGSTSNNQCNSGGIRISGEEPHFISLGNGRLSTGVTIFEIPTGNITIGSSRFCDIVIKGQAVLDVHCSVSRKLSEVENNLGDVTLSVLPGAKVLVEGETITDECVLMQGSMITLGENSYLRFNFPRRAAQLKTNGITDESKDKYDEVLRKSLNTSFVNFAEYNSDKSLNNNDKVSEKMKNLKMKTNDSYPKVTNMQAYPFSSNSIETVARKSGNSDEMQQLEQVLKMFVDYNNDNFKSDSNKSLAQSSTERVNSSPQHQNRIKTNGSLPKNFHAKEHCHNFEFYDENKSTDDIEVYKKPQSPRTRIKTFVSSPTKTGSGNCLSPADNNDKRYTDCKNTSAIESYEKDYEKLIKSFEEKFRMDIYNIQNCEKASASESAEHLADESYLDGEKSEVLSKIRELKILISEIQLQESETYLDSDVEKSLVLAEMSNEKSNLQMLNEKLSELKAQMKNLEMQRIKRQKLQEIQQIKVKGMIKDMEAEIRMLEKDKSPSSEKRLTELQEKLEIDRKNFEDLEFHYLEEETEWVSLHEEYKENISIFTQQIEEKKNIIQELEQTKQFNETSTQDEQKCLEKRLFNLKQKLENEREKLKNIDKMLSTKVAKSAEIPNGSPKLSAAVQNGSPKLSETPSNFDRNSNLMSKSFNENMFFNRNKIEVSHFDFNIDSVDNGSANVEEKVLNTEVASESRNGAVTKILSRNKSTEPESSNNASPLMLPKYHSLTSINAPHDDRAPNQANGSGLSNGVIPRAQLPKHKRPLTRYLPNFSLDFNLKHHIITAGHQIQLCPHVILDATSCRGYLNKVGAKPLFSNLRANNRWFVFDRERQMLVYYSDKNEKKPRGGAYFNAITDVYFDHSAMKNNRTFIVKTKNRSYTLQAPSQQACSIWIDVIITGAQGKMLEYDK